MKTYNQSTAKKERLKKLRLIPYRKRDKRFKFKKQYIVRAKKAKNGDLIILIPEDIVKAYHIEAGQHIVL